MTCQGCGAALLAAEDARLPSGRAGSVLSAAVIPCDECGYRNTVDLSDLRRELAERGELR